MSFDAGSARAAYILDIAQAKQAAAELRSLFAGLRQDAAALGRVQIGGAGGLGGQVAGTRQLRQEMDALRGSLQPVQQQTVGVTSAFGDLKTAAGALGIVLGGRQLVQYGIEAGQAALALDRTQRATRAIAGDTRTYNEIVAAARQQQILFGGSLQENLDQLSGLAAQSRISGASLTQLIDLQQRLAAFDPAQGASGARIALAEALSGNVASLSRRFEIPRSALQKLGDTSLPVSQRLQVLSQFLDKVGFSSAAVAGSISNDAKAFNEFNAGLDTFKTDLGAGLVATVAPAVKSLNSISASIHEITKAQTEYDKLNQRTRESIAPFGQAATVTGQLNNSFAGLAVGLDVLAGRTDDAKQRLRELTGQGEQAIPVFDRMGGVFDQERQAVQRATEARERQAQAGGVITDLADRQRAATDALAQSERRAADTALIDANTKDLAATKTQLLQQQTQAAADAFLAANPHITATGIQLAVASGAIDPMVAKLAELTFQIRDAKAALAGFSAGRPETGGDALARALDAPRKVAAFNDTQNARAAQARRDQILATGTHAQKLTVLTAEYQKQVQLFGPKSAEAIEAQTALLRERQSVAKAHTSELDKQLRLNESIYDSQQKQLSAALNLQEAAIKDRQDRRKEDREIAQAQRILNSPHASAEFKAAAADRIALIDVERQKRQLDIAQQSATAGGTIVNGRLLQSVQGGAPVAATAPATGGGRTGGGGAAPAQAAGGAGLTVQFVVSGKVIAEAIIPDVAAAALQGLNASRAGGGGQATP